MDLICKYSHRKNNRQKNIVKALYDNCARFNFAR